MIHRGIWVSCQDPGYEDVIVGTCELCLCPVYAYEKRIKIGVNMMHTDCVREMEDEKLAEMIGGELEDGDD